MPSINLPLRPVAEVTKAGTFTSANHIRKKYKQFAVASANGFEYNVRAKEKSPCTLPEIWKVRLWLSLGPLRVFGSYRRGSRRPTLERCRQIAQRPLP